MNTFQRTAAAFNKAIFPLLRVPVLGALLGRSTLVIQYVGRRSGRTFRLPVSYSRRPDGQLFVGVMAPDHKTWWRNFDGDGGPVTVVIRGDERSGHAVSHRDDAGRVSVIITLDAVAS